MSLPPREGNMLGGGGGRPSWDWDIPIAPPPTPLCIPAHLALPLLDEAQAYDAICKIYREYMKKDEPKWEFDSLQGPESRKATLHLDTNHVVFTNFTHHFRYTTEGKDYLLDVAKKRAALKAGQWLFDVLHKSGSVYNPSDPFGQPYQPAPLPLAMGPPPSPPPPFGTTQPQLLQEFMAHRAKTEEQLRVLSHTVAVLLEENKKLVKQNDLILKRLEEIKEAQSKSAFESLADAAFAQSRDRK